MHLAPGGGGKPSKTWLEVRARNSKNADAVSLLLVHILTGARLSHGIEFRPKPSALFKYAAMHAAFSSIGSVLMSPSCKKEGVCSSTWAKPFSQHPDNRNDKRVRGPQHENEGTTARSPSQATIDNRWTAQLCHTLVLKEHA